MQSATLTIEGHAPRRQPGVPGADASLDETRARMLFDPAQLTVE